MKSREFNRRPGLTGAPPFLWVALVIGAICATRFLALSTSPGEIDEAVFAGAVLHFDVFDLSPQAPGFPLWILIGRFFSLFFPSPYTALSIASTLLAMASLPALYSWGRWLVGGWAALAGVLFAAFLPVIWLNGGRAFSDSPSTAFFLIALATLSASERHPGARDTRRHEVASGRRIRLLAIAAGLATAAGIGIRPHLALAFGPVLLVGLVRLARRGDRHDAAVSFVLSAFAGMLAWGLWLVAQTGGLSGLVASLGERAGFRSQAFATGVFGTFTDSFLVRDFLSPRRAALVGVLALLGSYPLAIRGRRGALDLGLVLIPTFFSLWFLHNRAMSRYSVPFILVSSLLVGRGLQAVFRRGIPTLLGAGALAMLFGWETLPEARLAGKFDSPPIAALRSLERYVHPGRDTIIADDVFHPFLRLERWEGRLVSWGYLDSELVSGVRQTNRRLIRLADMTGEVDPADRVDPAWKSWSHETRVSQALGNGRLLSVSVRDPAPPLFGAGFGVKERLAGRPSFRWCGASGRLIVPGLEGPFAAFLSGDRAGDAGPTILKVSEAASGRLLVERRIEGGPFDLAIVPTRIVGPLSRPSEYLISCDRPKPLPAFAGATRPREGCFVFREATFSAPMEKLWEKQGARFLLEIGSPRDFSGDPQGFYARETIVSGPLDMRWASGSSSVVWAPIPGFVPSRLFIRARAPSHSVVEVTVLIGGVIAGTMAIAPGGFAETSLELGGEARSLLSGSDPARIVFGSSTWNPQREAKGKDGRELGIGVDRIALE